MKDRRQGDRRKWPRYDGDWMGCWDSGYYIEEVEVEDLSLGGCRIKHSGNILQGQSGQFRLTPFEWIHAEVIVHDINAHETISCLRFTGDLEGSGIEKLIAEVEDD